MAQPLRPGTCTGRKIPDRKPNLSVPSRDHTGSATASMIERNPHSSVHNPAEDVRVFRGSLGARLPSRWKGIEGNR